MDMHLIQEKHKHVVAIRTVLINHLQWELDMMS